MRYSDSTSRVPTPTESLRVAGQIPMIPLASRPTRRNYVVAGMLLSTIFFVGVAARTVAYSFKSAAVPEVLPSPVQTLVMPISMGSTTEPFAYGANQNLAQPNYFAETLASFKTQQLSFIEADLSLMRIRYYKAGAVVFEAPILTKGKDGSWWETPAGVYAVETKEKSHFSSFGKVYTPWNMAFQGNFFIHGWPYYPGGTPVSSQYSGGCIRLSDTDAEELFGLVAVATPVLVHERDYTSDGFSYPVAAPQIDASAYLVADLKSNTILLRSGEEQTLPIASLTKLMTALVASEYINLDNDITITTSAMASTSVNRLTPGMTLSGYSLLLPLLLESDNVAARTLAQSVGTGHFVSLMNKKARSLGMASTTFTDASGSDSGNVSTLSDLLRLATYLYHNRSFIYRISSGENVPTAYNVYPFTELKNFNAVPGIEKFVGGKVGKTAAARETIMSVYRMNIRGEERTLAYIVLGTDDNYGVVQKLHEYVTHYYGR